MKYVQKSEAGRTSWRLRELSDYPQDLRENSELICIELLSHVTLATVKAISVDSESNTWSTEWAVTVLSKRCNFGISGDIVVLQDVHGVLLMLVLGFLGSGIVLLFLLLPSSSKTQDQVKGRFLLDIVIREGSSVFELLTGENQTLLLRWNSFLVLDLRFHIGDSIIWLNVQGDRFSREGFHKYLHSHGDFL